MTENMNSNQPGGNTPKLPLIIMAMIGIGLIGYCIFGAIVLLNPNRRAPAETNILVTSTLTSIPTSTSLPAPRETAQAPETKPASQWTVLLADTFDTNLSNWDIGEFLTEDIDAHLKIGGGKYHWDATPKNTIQFRSFPSTLPQVTDFQLSTDVKLTGGTYAPVYGLVFRENSNGDGYFFGIYGESFTITKSVGGEQENIVEIQKSQAVLPQDVNHLMVIAEGSNFEFYINDQLVHEMVDETSAQGVVGLGVTFYKVDLQNTFEFDNFIVKVP